MRQPLRPAHDERAVDRRIGPHRLDRAIDDGSSVLLPDVAAPAAGRIVERNDLELLFHEQAEQEEGREPDGDGQRPPAPAPAPFQLHTSPKIRSVDPDPLQELRRPAGRRLAFRSGLPSFSRRPIHPCAEEERDGCQGRQSNPRFCRCAVHGN